MKIIDSVIYEGRNIYSHKKCIKITVDLEGYSEIPSKDIKDFNDNLIEMVPELRKHRCGIDEDEGFIKRLREGTYLSHICEHLIIAIQNVIGVDISYGKAREINGDIYMIVYQYEYAKVGIECAKLSVDIINSLINGKCISVYERILILKEILKEEMPGPSTASICNAAREIGLPVIQLSNSAFCQIGYGKQGKVIEASISTNTSCVAVDISCDKLLTKELLRIQNIPVAKGSGVSNVINLLKEAESIGYPVVLKPQFGSKGKGVILSINDDKELLLAYDKLKQKYNEIIIEKYYEGNDYRVCVVNYEVVAASMRVPPYIIGDGKSTIKELINLLNGDDLRGDDHEKPLSKVKIDDELLKLLNNKKYTLDMVLEDGCKLFLRKNANLSTGGTAVDCTDIISQENKDLCVRVAKSIGLDICGVDVCIDDISKPIAKNGIIIEVNSAPGLRMHAFPSQGKKREIGKKIVDMMYNNNPVNIPVISITGTNGKTTTTRLVASVLKRMGYVTGMTSTDGIYINDECIDDGDDTGVESAKCILLNKDVDIAVLETARGGIVKRGLAYDLADVAAITNISEDHLGCNNIETMEELCLVKSLVAEAVKEDGYVVINADDKWSRKIIPRIKSKIIYFSNDSNNDLILKNISLGEIAIYIKDSCIYANNRGIEYKLNNISNIPITLNGALEFNVENAMVACGILIGLGVDYSMIKIGLNKFGLNLNENSGRFNVHDCNGIKVILDYGHNIEGYKKVLKSLKQLSNGKIIGVIGLPGDRTDHCANEIGRISAQFVDKIIIKEDKCKRGRKTGEIAKLIEEGVIGVKSDFDYKIILHEDEALKYALKEASQGDTIIVFYEDQEPLIKIIEDNNRIIEQLGTVVNSN